MKDTKKGYKSNSNFNKNNGYKSTRLTDENEETTKTS